MANLKKLQSKRKIRSHRCFSEDFKRSKVKEIEDNISTVSEIQRTYDVSKTSIYRWIYRYSNHLKKGTIQVVEMDSDTRKIEKLKQKVRELERIIGQKQIQLDFQDKLIEIAGEEFGVDLKKKFGSEPSYGSGNTGENTDGK